MGKLVARQATASHQPSQAHSKLVPYSLIFLNVKYRLRKLQIDHSLRLVVGEVGDFGL